MDLSEGSMGMEVWKEVTLEKHDNISLSGIVVYRVKTWDLLINTKCFVNQFIMGPLPAGSGRFSNQIILVINRLRSIDPIKA